MSDLEFGVKTLFAGFKHGLAVGGDRLCLGRRPVVDGKAQPFVWETFEQVHKRILNAGSALAFRGLTKGSKVGVFSINRPEWVISEQVCNAFG